MFLLALIMQPKVFLLDEPLSALDPFLRVQMRQEIRYWQEQAERSKVRADLLAQENEAWAAGYKQGREDVITIVPHITAQQRLLAQDRTTDAAGMTGCA